MTYPNFPVGMTLFLVFNTLCFFLTELRPLREKYQDLSAEYDKTKQTHDSTAAGLDSSLAKLEQVLYPYIFSKQIIFFILDFYLFYCTV